MLNYLYNFIFIERTQKKDYHKLFFFGLCIGLIMRFGMFWLIDYKFDVGDGRFYLDAAYNLLEHHTYSGDTNSNPIPGMYRPPFYSFFIASIGWLFGENPLYVQLVQIFISIVTAFLITRISAFFLPKAAPWVFFLMMLSPFESVYAGAILSETLVTFLLVATICVILTVDGLKRWVIGGVLLGLSILTRDVYMPLIIIIVGFWIIFGISTKGHRFLEAIVFVLSVCLVVVPWTLRNYHISERLVPVSDGRLGLSLWFGTWATDGDFTKNDALGLQRVYPSKAFSSEHEKELVKKAFEQGGKEGDQKLKDVAIQRIYNAPLDVFKVYCMRAPLLWLGTRFDIFQLNKEYFPRGSPPYTMVKIIFWGINFLFVAFACLGILIALYQHNKILIMAIPIIYTAMIYFPLNSFENRYSQPVYPFLIIFIGFSATVFMNKYNMIKFRNKYNDE